MSLLHLDLGYPDRARMGYERARPVAPESAIVWKLLGCMQAWKGHCGDAVASFEQASAAAPRDAEAYLDKGIALARMYAKPDEALAELSRALELDPSLPDARLEAANIYFQAKQDYRRAAAELEQVIAGMPGQARARQLLTQAYSRAGERVKAAAQAAELKRLEASSR
jgi:Tfp pilus assembly protein PilF